MVNGHARYDLPPVARAQPGDVHPSLRPRDHHGDGGQDGPDACLGPLQATGPAEGRTPESGSGVT
jgi:hypothetical protein